MTRGSSKAVLFAVYLHNGITTRVDGRSGVNTLPNKGKNYLIHAICDNLYEKTRQLAVIKTRENT